MKNKTLTIHIFSALILLSQFVYGDAIARVVKANGDVLLMRSGSQKYNEAVVSGTGINNGDAIQVGEESFAMVIYIDDRSFVKIKERTEFQFVDTQNTRTIKLQIGTLLNDIKKNPEGRTFRIETSASVASVKGTKFSVIADPSGIDQFFGLEGQVEVFNMISGQTATLLAGQKIISNTMGNLMTAPANPNEYPEDPEGESEEVEVEEETPTEESEEETPAEDVDAPQEIDTPSVEDQGAPGVPESPVTEEPESPAEEPQGQTPKPYGMGLGIGSVTIDGTLYNQLALRPELKFGKLGVGLDLVFYIDNEGNFWDGPWNIKDEPGLLLDKILYIRWGEKTDPLWFKWGSLEKVVLGYGGLVNGYSNMMEFPSVRRVGVNSGFNFGKFGGEIFFANMKDMIRGGTLVGLRSTYTVSKKFPLTVGVNVVSDINQFSGLKDRDDDSYPDIFDDFPDDGKLWNDTDGDGLADYNGGSEEPEIGWDKDGDNNNEIADWAGGTDNEELKGTPFSIEDNQGSATGFAVDIGYPVLKNKLFSLMVFSEYNMLSFPAVKAINRPERKGTGITVPGIRASILKIVHISLEYRMKQEHFVPQFFDQGYDLNRVIAVYDEEAQNADIYTKDMLLFADPSSVVNTNGLFGSASMSLFNLVDFSAAYANMEAEDVVYRSFFAQLNLNTENIPKLSAASAYYQRNNDENPFDFQNPSENTVLGYQVGYEISDGVSLIWDYRQYYRDVGNGLEPVKQTSIETAFTF